MAARQKRGYRIARLTENNVDDRAIEILTEKGVELMPDADQTTQIDAARRHFIEETGITDHYISSISVMEWQQEIRKARNDRENSGLSDEEVIINARKGLAYRGDQIRRRGISRTRLRFYHREEEKLADSSEISR